MIIDYIYLLLILILISSILYFIYLSYEYRHNNIETFVDLQLNMPSDVNYNNLLNTYLQSQQQQLSNVYNRQVSGDIQSYQKLQKQLDSNVRDTNILLKQKTDMNVIPQSFPIDKLIKTIKSNYNSQYISLFANDINKYGVLINDKCFTVNGLCKDEYCTQTCQNNLYTSDSQKFYTNRIQSSDDISRLMKIPKDKINSKNVYPFNIFRSAVSDKCLSVNDDGLYIENCNLNNINHQWSISPDENICVLK